LHFPTYKTPSFATFSFQGNASKEHICLWVIVRQRFMSCTQANAVSRLTPFWCQVNFALIKLLTKSVNDIYCLSVCLSVLYSRPSISLPSCKLIMSVSQHVQQETPEFLPSLKIDAWSPCSSHDGTSQMMSPLSLELCSFQSCGSDVSSSTSSPACTVQHISPSSISPHGTGDCQRPIISSPVVNKSFNIRTTELLLHHQSAIYTTTVCKSLWQNNTAAATQWN
jgi:hypothetical protein